MTAWKRRDGVEHQTSAETRSVTATARPTAVWHNGGAD
jgi:hypothetical protein